MDPESDENSIDGQNRAPLKASESTDASVMALLMMGEENSFKEPLRASSTNEEYDDQTFKTRFLHIYNAYVEQACPEGVGSGSHLLVTCLEQMICFCTWARSTNQTQTWIFSTLLHSADLRPELRNGLAMILMYTFAAAKADALKNGSDMFTVVMDADYGLGIIHKTSLRVYNDPYFFFNFLKMTMTGLIECGALKENERISQSNPKTRRKHYEVESECLAFEEMKQMVAQLAKENLTSLKSKVEDIVTAWQQKKAKSTAPPSKFATAVALLKMGYMAVHIPGVPLVSQGNMVMMQPVPQTVTNGMGVGIMVPGAVPNNSMISAPVGNVNNGVVASNTVMQAPGTHNVLVPSSGNVSGINANGTAYSGTENITIGMPAAGVGTMSSQFPAPNSAVVVPPKLNDVLTAAAACHPAHGVITTTSGQKLTLEATPVWGGTNGNSLILASEKNAIAVGKNTADDPAASTPSGTFDGAPQKKRAKVDAAAAGAGAGASMPLLETDIVSEKNGVTNQIHQEHSNNDLCGMTSTTVATPLPDRQGLFIQQTATSAQNAINSVLVGENAYSVVQLDPRSELVNVVPVAAERKEFASVSDITSLVDAVNAHNSLNSNLNISIESVSNPPRAIFPAHIPGAPVDTPPPAPYVGHRASLNALRCDRVGTSTWNLHDVQIFDITAFIEEQVTHQVYTIDIRAITDNERINKRLEIQSSGLISLESEFRFRGALQTVYPRAEFKQLKAYMETCLAICSGTNEVDGTGVSTGTSVDPIVRSSGETLFPGGDNSSIVSIPAHCTYHKLGAGTSSADILESTNSEISESSIFFAYERIVQVGFIVRPCKSLSIVNEVWRMPYVDDIARFAMTSNSNTKTVDPTPNDSIGIVGFFINMFPQLKGALNSVNTEDYDNIIVKYYAQLGTNTMVHEGNISNPCGETDEGLYQSIGTFSLSVNELIARYEMELILIMYICICIR